MSGFDRRWHAARAWDLWLHGGPGLTRLETLRVFVSHLVGLVRP